MKAWVKRGTTYHFLPGVVTEQPVRYTVLTFANSVRTHVKKLIHFTLILPIFRYSKNCWRNIHPIFFMSQRRWANFGGSIFREPIDHSYPADATFAPYICFAQCRKKVTDQDVHELEKSRKKFKIINEIKDTTYIIMHIGRIFEL